ncbi:Ig-like domain-containing protein [Patescibacteria group bacterium]|nr:Ig-like domain-containing protein [Patescibacteria group bacterium]MCL5091557.1 Ig-like domain-containing protein [Patescibacteria group bacterium]
MRKTLIFLLIALFILLVFSGYFWLYEAQYFIGRADVSHASFSVDNSYMFVTPLRAKANNQDKIRVTVFVLNNQGLGVMGKTVTVAPGKNLTVETIQGLTDNSGKAVFDVTGSQTGEYYLEVKVENTTLPQKVHLSYY